MPESCKTTGTMDVPWSGRRSFRAAVLLALLAAGLPPLCSAARKRYSSHWLVEVEGGMEMANMIANKHKLLNLGPVRGKREREREGGSCSFTDPDPALHATYKLLTSNLQQVFGIVLFELEHP